VGRLQVAPPEVRLGKHNLVEPSTPAPRFEQEIAARIRLCIADRDRSNQTSRSIWLVHCPAIAYANEASMEATATFFGRVEVF
jgi:hypothetical protein